MGLDLANVVAECFDGASNMSGIHRGLATRMKESSPLGIYIHCYACIALSDALSKYLHGKGVDVAKAKKTADAVVKTLSGCRSEKNFELVWDYAEAMGRQIKPAIKDTAFDFKEATLPCNRQPSKSAQALIGETPGKKVLNFKIRQLIIK
eukprot:gene9023-16667_t